MISSRNRIGQLPFRFRLALCLLYLAALGLIVTGVTISWLRGFGPGTGAGLALETFLVIHLLRQVLLHNMSRLAVIRTGSGNLKLPDRQPGRAGTAMSTGRKHMQIVRTERETGGPNRTPREEIIPVFGENDEVEPEILFDCSESESWEITDGSSTSRWLVQMEAIRQLVAGAEAMDSQAAAEQAGGSGDKGGLYAAGFNHELVKVGATGRYDQKYVAGRAEDDEGDLNSANFEGKIAALRTGHGEQVPSGGTQIMQATGYLDCHYLGEFGNRPAAARPRRARAVFTDGELRDAAAFGRRLAEEHDDEWPSEDWFIAILGHGDEHDRTLRQYQDIAARHKNVHVYSFDQVSNPAEIAEDMAVAVLPQPS